MKLWKKIYMAVMVLFILVLNICNAAVFRSIYRGNVDVAERASVSLWDSIAMPFAEDWPEAAGNRASEAALFQGYVSYFGRNDLALELWQADTLCYKSVLGTQQIYSYQQEELHSDFSIQREGIWRERGENVCAVVLSREGRKYTSVAGVVPGTQNTLVVYEDVTDALSQWKEHLVFFLLMELLASVLMALLLYAIMHRFLQPVETISKAAASVAAGDYSYVPEVKGRDEIADLARDIQIMTEQVKEYVSSKEEEAARKQEFADMMAHELRTPLTSIHGYAELMKTAFVPEDKKIEYLDYMIRESGRMTEMVQVLRRITLLKREQEQEQWEEVSLSSLVAFLISQIQMEQPDTGVLYRIESETGTLFCQRVLTEMFFMNLLRNAFSACGEGGEIHVSISPQRAVVRDTGRGMSEECREHIFEPFYREDKSRSRRHGGTGLGMYLCKTIADFHGWEMEIRSRKGEGTEITVRFIINP